MKSEHSTLNIDHARPGDAAMLAKIYVDAWRDTYPGLLPDRTLVEMAPEAHARRWRGQIERIGDMGVIRVARLHNRGVVGFGSAGPMRLNEKDTGEIYTLYVDPAFQDRGIGRHLLSALLADLGARGYKNALLWVVTGNPACFFYERMGGRRLSERTERLWGADVAQVCYTWPLIGRTAPR